MLDITSSLSLVEGIGFECQQKTYYMYTHPVLHSISWAVLHFPFAVLYTVLGSAVVGISDSIIHRHSVHKSCFVFKPASNTVVGITNSSSKPSDIIHGFVLYLAMRDVVVSDPRCLGNVSTYPVLLQSCLHYCWYHNHCS